MACHCTCVSKDWSASRHAGRCWSMSSACDDVSIPTGLGDHSGGCILQRFSSWRPGLLGRASAPCRTCCTPSSSVKRNSLPCCALRYIVAQSKFVKAHTFLSPRPLCTTQLTSEVCNSHIVYSKQQFLALVLPKLQLPCLKLFLKTQRTLLCSRLPSPLFIKTWLTLFPHQTSSLALDV